MMGFQVSEFSCPWGVCSGCKICWGFLSLRVCCFSMGAEKKANQPLCVPCGDRKLCSYLGVSKKCGTPKWMVYMENPIKMDDLGVPLFSENIHFHPTTPLFSCGHLRNAMEIFIISALLMPSEENAVINSDKVEKFGDANVSSQDDRFS